jgi:hypothetical protein
MSKQKAKHKPRRKSYSSQRLPNVTPATGQFAPGQREATVDALHLQVGRAISAWEELQSALVSLLGTILQANWWTREALGAPHANVGALSKMVHTAAERCTKGELREDIQSLNDEILRFAQRRNDIAHAIVAKYCNGKYIDMYLRPADTTTHAMKNFDTPEYFWNVAQLTEYTHQFKRMAAECHALTREVIELREEK